MRWHLLLVIALLRKGVSTIEEEDNDDDGDEFGNNLIAELKNDANLDLSVDEEYEDLRAELLAYHTALAQLASSASRRTMKYNPCWQLGGICINYKMCSGFRYLTEVKGCRDALNVCCFTWNKYQVRDMQDQGFSGSVRYPWSSTKYNPEKGKSIIEVENVFPAAKLSAQVHKSDAVIDKSDVAVVLNSEREVSEDKAAPELPLNLDPENAKVLSGLAAKKIYKPQRFVLGSMKTTCWSRGGSCMDIRDCGLHKFDGKIPGCMSGFKVCCLNLDPQPPLTNWKKLSDKLQRYKNGKFK